MVDADLSGYFDSIPHAELMKSVSRRISDGRILRLIKMWLEAWQWKHVTGRDGKSERPATKTREREPRKKSPISPLLSNIYMRRFIRGWKTQGHEKRLRARIVNYADDFVICCRAGADEAMATMRSMMAKLKLTVNETKTRLSVLPDGAFDFLGYTFGQLVTIIAREQPIWRYCRRSTRSPSCATRSVNRRPNVAITWTKGRWWAG